MMNDVNEIRQRMGLQQIDLEESKPPGQLGTHSQASSPSANNHRTGVIHLDGEYEEPEEDYKPRPPRAEGIQTGVLHTGDGRYEQVNYEVVRQGGSIPDPLALEGDYVEVEPEEEPSQVLHSLLSGKTPRSWLGDRQRRAVRETPQEKWSRDQEVVCVGTVTRTPVVDVPWTGPQVLGPTLAHTGARSKVAAVAEPSCPRPAWPVVSCAGQGGATVECGATKQKKAKKKIALPPPVSPITRLEELTVDPFRYTPLTHGEKLRAQE
jgi:hypothetical protein